MSRFFFNHAAHGTPQPSTVAASDAWHEGWTVAELRDKAAELEIEGRSKLKRAELIAAIEQAED